MWIITHATTGESVCLLPKKLTYSIGRLGADVELQEDICVSRAHAALHLVKGDDGLKLELEDMGSKYGTFLNKDIETNTVLAKGLKIALKNNDLIRFGRLQNLWRVQFMTIHTATSSLHMEDNQQLKACITELGGKILDEWSPNCTHLTMKDPSVTMKLLHALIEQKPVVTPAYWKDLLNAANGLKVQLPKMESYRPDFEDDDMDFSCNVKRQTLFKGYTFVFLHRKHFDMYGPIVMSGGGACKDLNSGVQKAFLIKDKVVVIQYTPSTQTQSSQTINTIADFLESNSKRIIPEYEIGLAVLRCSMEKFCNPSYKMPQTTPIYSFSESHDSNQVGLAGNQNTSSFNTESMDLVISETNDNLVNPALTTTSSNKDQEQEQSMSGMHVTETPTENPKKRKIMSVELNEADDDLFQFQSKKTCNKIDENSDKMNTVEQNLNKTSTINIFLQKTQHKSQLCLNQTVAEQPSTSKETRKRPLIQVLNEDDEGNEDDLFSFGDTQNPKKTRKETDEDSNLFNFKEQEESTAKKPIRTIAVDEDSSDMQSTQQFIVVTKKPAVQMPKPKILPRKISGIEWIASSLGKINIKKEKSGFVITENENGNGYENTIKTEAEVKTELGADITITEDHRKWLESLKDAIEIQQVALNNTIKSAEKSHYKFKNQSSHNDGNVNGNMSNFKRFVKKYHAPSDSESTGIKLHLR